MTQKFQSFVLLAEMRTGSNFLEASLNALPGVNCYGEVFNPHFIGRLNQTEMLGIDLAARERDPLALLHRMRERTQGLSGFRYFHDHDPRILPQVLADPACAKIILTRNPLESYVSWKIAKATGQWKLTQAQKLKSTNVRFDGVEFRAHLDQLQAFQVVLMNGLQTTGQTAFYIDYEDINDVAVLNGLARFLGVEGELAAPDGNLKKQNPEEISQKVENPAQMEVALAQLDRFNLHRTPNFEPRRAPAVPSYSASGPLLFMPIKGGPEDAVAGWLSRIGEVEAEFNQKSLRQWLRRNPNHRSFTVLRHPVARAYAGFCTQILSGRLRNIREALIKTYKIGLPDEGQVLPLADHRAAFLAFLQFLKLNIAGQSGLRVDAHFATQTAVLQGFTQFQHPDLVLREDRLAQGLAFMTSEVGLDCPAVPLILEAPPHPLQNLYDDEIEAATRDAYMRDYQGFGFDVWCAL